MYGILLCVQVAAPRPNCGSDSDTITTPTTGARLTLCSPSAPNSSCAGAAWHAWSAGSQIRGDQAAVGSWDAWARISKLIQHACQHVSSLNSSVLYRTASVVVTAAAARADWLSGIKLVCIAVFCMFTVDEVVHQKLLQCWHVLQHYYRTKRG